MSREAQSAAVSFVAFALQCLPLRARQGNLCKVGRGWIILRARAYKGGAARERSFARSYLPQ